MKYLAQKVVTLLRKNWAHRTPHTAHRTPHTALLVLLLMVAIVLIPNSCKKDTIPQNQSHVDPLAFAWSPLEMQFFKLQQTISSVNEPTAIDRAEINFNPKLIEVYNQIALENEQTNYIDEVVSKVGFPNWHKTLVYSNNISGDELLLIPFYFENAVSTTALMSVTKKQTESTYIINITSRVSVLDVGSGDPVQKMEAARWMMRYDSILFGNIDANLKTAFCSYKDLVKDRNGEEWRIIEICFNTDDNYLEGVPGGGAQSGGSGQNTGASGGTYSGTGGWGTIGHTLGWGGDPDPDGGGHQDSDDEDEGDGDGGGKECVALVRIVDPPCILEVKDPFSGGVGDRELDCEYYHVLGHAAGNNFWYDLDEVIPCYNCLANESEIARRKRLLEDMIVNYDLDVELIEMLEFSGDCDVLSPFFEECIISTELGEFEDFFETKGIITNEQKMQLIFGRKTPYLPECIGCSVGQKDKVWTAFNTAQTKMACSIKKLKEYIRLGSGASVPGTHIALETFLGPGDNFSQAEMIDLAHFIKNRLQWINFQSSYGASPPDFEIQSNDANSIFQCGATTLAWSFPCLQATNIRLCDPGYFTDVDPFDDESLPTQQWATLVHEMAHLYYCATDAAYVWNTQIYNNLSTSDRVSNASNIAEFVKLICQ